MSQPSRMTPETPLANNKLVFHCRDMPTGSWRGFWDFTLGPKVTEQPLLGMLSQQSHSQDREEREMANTVPEPLHGSDTNHLHQHMGGRQVTVPLGGTLNRSGQSPHPRGALFSLRSLNKPFFTSQNLSHSMSIIIPNVALICSLFPECPS